MFTGATHDSADILKHQTASSRERKPAVIDSLQAAKDLAYQGRELLARGDLDQFGRLLHEGWMCKRRFAPGVTTPMIDRMYDIARNNGALGGKIAGAGGGGFLMLYCETDAISRVESALSAQGLRRLGFQMESDGGRVLFNAGLRLERDGLTEGALAFDPMQGVRAAVM